ncbi:uncharacterized protein LAJ45_09962 [Morchella importuna]|nr:uncharacterized protein LAJ45_09962 [Morchella importuna]KAH8146040.1 hypothetical protein LAJ45_09962 [Morchella importuna]
MAVFKDGSEVASTPPPIATNNGDCDEDDNENNKRHENNSSHRLPPPRKKTRVRKGSPVAAAAAAAPRTRRVALKEKATNPSSSDVLHPIDKDESFYGKQPTRRRANLPTNDKAKALEPTSTRSPLQEISNTSNSLHQTLKEKLPTKTFDELVSLVVKDAAQDAANLITKNDCWSPELLDCFRASKLTSLELSSQAASFGEFVIREPFSEIVKKLFQQDQFSNLTVISFRNTQLLNDDVASLRLLSHLESLDLTGTGVGTQSLHHLVCHRHTLKRLNLSHNPLIDDDARVALSAFPNLAAIYLRGTSITMPGLRRFVQGVLPLSCRLLSIPEQCINYLNTRQEKYMVDIPEDYVQDPARVDALTLPALKRNLEFHGKANKDIHVTGTKAELNNRLFVILSNRLADSKIIGVMGRAPVAT